MTVSYTFDVFGLNRRQVEALRAQTDFQRDELDAARLTLAANVIEAAITEAALNAQVQAQQRVVADAEKSLDIIRRQFADGAATRLDVATQEAAVAQARAGLPPLVKSLDQDRDLLAALTGLPAQGDEALSFELSAFAPGGVVPESVSADRVAQRPDVRAATEQWRAANAQLGVAVASRLPQFTLTASDGGAASRISQMFMTGGPFWNVAGDASATLFDGGQLRHRELAAKAGVDQARAQYRSTLISAMQNVADSLHALRADEDALQAAAAGAEATRKSLSVTQSQLNTGYATPLAVLAADQALKQTEITELQARQARLDDIVGLYQSLAGRWQ